MSTETPRPRRRPVGRRFRPRLDHVEARVLLSTFTVTNVNDNGPGSLRQAIYDADDNGGTDTIAFDIPGSGPQVITPLGALPPITTPVTIDGDTQPGSSANTSTTGDNALPMIVLDGSAITNIAQSLGLQVQADDSTVEGLDIENFGGIGVVLSGVDDVVQGDFIGTDPTGMSAQPDSLGIGVIGSGDVIGGTTAAARDLISGDDIGVAMASLSIGGTSLLTAEAGSTIQGDLIGTNATGTGNLGNAVIGVALAGSGNVVGGTAAGQANTIAFNGADGSALNLGVGVVVIGLSPSASSPISVESTGNVISGNSIYGNHNMGIGLLDIPTATVMPLLSTSTAQIPSVVANFLGTVNLGPVPNAQLPTGSGPNDLLNFPDLATAVSQNGSTTVNGTLSGTPNSSFQVQFFSDPTADANGLGEGQTYLGSATVTTNAQGVATISDTLSSVPVGAVIAATAIDRSGNTSEFSKAVTVTSQTPTTTPALTSTPQFGVGTKSNTAVLGFNEQLNPSGASNIGNYTLFLVRKRPHGKTKLTSIPLSSASYDPSTMSVTLTPRKKVKKNSEVELNIDGAGVTDLNGHPMTGSNGVPGGTVTITESWGHTKARR